VHREGVDARDEPNVAASPCPFLSGRVEVEVIGAVPLGSTRKVVTTVVNIVCIHFVKKHRCNITCIDTELCNLLHGGCAR
jgi:hypothetical protein